MSMSLCQWVYKPHIRRAMEPYFWWRGPLCPNWFSSPKTTPKTPSLFVAHARREPQSSTNPTEFSSRLVAGYPELSAGVQAVNRFFFGGKVIPRLLPEPQVRYDWTPQNT